MLHLVIAGPFFAQVSAPRMVYFIPLGSDDAVNHLRQTLIANIAFLTGVGALSASLVKVLGGLSPVSAWINKNFLVRWTAEQIRTNHALVGGAAAAKKRKIFGLTRPSLTLTPVKGTFLKFTRDFSSNAAWAQIVQLSVAGHEEALLTLESSKLCGQLNAGARVALQFPETYPDFFAVLTSSVGNSAQLNAYLQGVSNPGYTDAKINVGNAAQRTMDALQILLDARWVWWRQLMGFFFSVAIALAALASFTTARSGIFFAHLVISSIVGAFLAPVAVSLSESLGGRSSGS